MSVDSVYGKLISNHEFSWIDFKIGKPKEKKEL